LYILVLIVKREKREVILGLASYSKSRISLPTYYISIEAYKDIS